MPLASTLQLLGESVLSGVHPRELRRTGWAWQCDYRLGIQHSITAAFTHTHRHHETRARPAYKFPPMSTRSLASSTTGWLLFCFAVRADLFVSTSGSDANSGFKSKPFATLERACESVRELKRAAKIPKAGLTVWLRGG